MNGLLVTRTQVPSFIVTLATLFAVGGLTLALSDFLDQQHQRVDAISRLGQGSLWNTVFWVPLGCVLVDWIDRCVLVLSAQIALGQLGVCRWRRSRKRAQCRYSCEQAEDLALYPVFGMHSACWHVSGDPVQFGPVSYLLQHDLFHHHRECCWRGSFERWLWLCCSGWSLEP